MINDLLKYQKEISNLQYTINLLLWELKVNAPKNSQDDLVSLISSYESKLFQLQTSDCYEEIINSAIDSNEFKNLSQEEQRYIYHLKRHFNEYKNVPKSFYNKYIELKNKSNIIWKEAKENSNYELFKPYLEQMVEFTKQYYRYIDSNTNNLYDVMLNNYETGVTSEMIDKLFEELKERIKSLIPKTNMDIYVPAYTYTIDELMECAKYLLDYIGFDLNRGTLGIYPHGYTEKMNSNDIRIAFRYNNDPIDFVTTIIHEGGHAIFEQNIDRNLSQYENTTIDNLYALHESQSRFYENILGRNINFWIPIYDDIKKMLHLDISIDQFVQLLNTPRCGVIRVTADELTYCMHIILRYEIERDLFNGNITVDEIPKIWTDKMKNYLNVDVHNDSEGLMQDVHWAEGYFGYFPSYLVGSIYDGMFLEIIEKQLGSIDELLRSGRIKEITTYLINNIYRNGGAYTSLEIINKMCGKEVTVDPIVAYFEKKYSKKQ